MYKTTPSVAVPAATSGPSSKKRKAAAAAAAAAPAKVDEEGGRAPAGVGDGHGAPGKANQSRPQLEVVLEEVWE